MQPVLVCVEYPDEVYPVGTEISLPLFVANDLLRGLGMASWSWVLRLGDSAVVRDAGEVEVPEDSVVEIGEVRAALAVRGRATLRISLSWRDTEVSNQYEFQVGQAGRPSSCMSSGMVRKR